MKQFNYYDGILLKYYSIPELLEGIETREETQDTNQRRND